MDLQNRTHDLGKVFGKAILPRLLQRIDIKGAVVVEIGADALQKPHGLSMPSCISCSTNSV